MVTVIRNYAMKEYILKKYSYMPDNVSLITQIERLREILAQMQKPSKIAAPVLAQQLRKMMSDSSY